MRPYLFQSLLLALALWLSGAAMAAGMALPVDRPHAGPIGLSVDYLKETGGELTIDQAAAAYRRGAFLVSRKPVPDFGIGSQPVWLHFGVANPTDRAVAQRLTIETPWLDQIDLYFRQGGRTLAAYHAGDREPFARRPVDSRYFAFKHDFAPGGEDVFIRVATPDPMVLPIYLMGVEQAEARSRLLDYSYGFLYGFVIALMAYNAMLYAGLRQSRYILYSLYLAMFLLMNISYSGHGFKWLWPDHTTWEQWSNPILIVLYGTSGLTFALAFLDTRTHLPRVHKAVIGFMAVSGLLELLSILIDSQRDALLVAFVYAFLFSIVMLAIGALSMRSGRKPARYFLLAALSAMIGAALTALSVAGIIPYNAWTFRAVDIGVLLDATLLALALTYQFRTSQQEKLQAEQLANLDPLTGVNNRRAFYDLTAPIWNIALRNDRDLSVIMLDIDHFKEINDAHGHAVGDDTLTTIAGVLTGSIRVQDVIARWGGEEFIILLPETGLQEAAALAERLRRAIEAIRLKFIDAEITVTASFGVAQRGRGQQSLDALISTADDCLYEAKAGRNRVCCGRQDAAGAGTSK